MVEFKAIILQFTDQGEKTGWTYIEITADISDQIKPGCKRSYRVRGSLDAFAISGIALMPMGNGKTAETRSKRIVNTVNAMLRKWDYGRMIREMRKD